MVFISEIPRSVKIGIIGEFFGRIGMGLLNTYFIFYLIFLTGSLVYYPIFLTSFLVCTILGSTLSGLLGSKYSGSKLLRKISFVGPLLILATFLSIGSIEGMFILYNFFAFVFSFFNPLFSSLIITETKQESRDLSYSFYKGATIIGQNLSGFIGGFILIILFLNTTDLHSLSFLLILGFILLGSQIILLFFVQSNGKIVKNDVTNKPKTIKEIKKQLTVETGSNEQIYSKSTTYVILVSIAFSAIGVGLTYSYIALFITKIYTSPLGDISIILGIIGLITGLTTFTTSYFTKKIKRNKMLGLSDLLYGLTSIFLFFYPPLLLLYLILFFREIASSITSPIANVILLTTISDKKRNLISSFGILTGLVSELIGSVLAVLMIDNTGIFYNFVIAGIFFIISGSITLLMIKEKERSKGKN